VAFFGRYLDGRHFRGVGAVHVSPAFCKQLDYV
jgi:hypothetical protein